MKTRDKSGGMQEGSNTDIIYDLAKEFTWRNSATFAVEEISVWIACLPLHSNRVPLRCKWYFTV
jgi:hypothetical protein